MFTAWAGASSTTSAVNNHKLIDINKDYVATSENLNLCPIVPNLQASNVVRLRPIFEEAEGLG
jgi:hypothetical protein